MSAQHTIIEPSYHAKKEGKAKKVWKKTSTRAGKSNRARVTFLSLVAIIWGHVTTCGSVLIIESRLWNSMRSEPRAYIYTECAHGQAHQVEFHPGPCCHQIASGNRDKNIGTRTAELWALKENYSRAEDSTIGSNWSYILHQTTEILAPYITRTSTYPRMI